MTLVPLWGFGTIQICTGKVVISVPDYDNRIAEARRAEAEARAEACYQSFKQTGHVCGGCELSHLCRMEQDTAKWLFQEFLPAIERS
jgi:hypothetical protein